MTYRLFLSNIRVETFLLILNLNTGSVYTYKKLIIEISIYFCNKTGRQPGQSSADEIRDKDYRVELEEKERAAREKKEKRSFTGVYYYFNNVSVFKTTPT